VLDEEGLVSEPSAIIDLADVIPGGRTVFAGNSMPVRDIDSFWPTTSDLSSIVFFRGNRGASGIDGLVSTALGVAARSYGFLVAVIGDISFYHDMNGLLAAQRHGLNATIVLVNNDGGGIFSFLPQHEQSEDFEALFGTPHGLDFSHVGPLYGVGFQRVATRQAYREALKASFEAPGVQVIEVRTDREENLRLHQRIWAAVAEAVEPVVEETAL
jgi:2-succinyl-5-enolpyruvyl-6-hydroxy-3-cyclohexene-1-carboxylate synthase